MSKPVGEVLISLRIDISEVRDELRRISEELYELQQRTDPYMPTAEQWALYPWARYHTVDQDGKGVYWRNGGIVLAADSWCQDEDTLQQYEEDPEIYDMRSCGPWEQSLRVRPASVL